MKGKGGEFRPAPGFLAFALGCSIVLLAADVGPVSAARAASQSVKETGKTTSGKQSKDQPINIESTKLDYYDKEQKLVYTGDVVAIQGDVTLKTPLLVVFLTPKESSAGKGPPSSASQMRRWEASGPVTLISKDQIATGDSGIYEKAENKFYLNGNVTLTQGDYITKGDHAVHDLDTGRSIVTGHVRSMFPPKNNSEDTPKKDDDGGRKSGKLSDKPEAKSKTQ
ncbi:MAG: LptA/OstA family protein [Beijerinckiaceae bacterium]